MQRTWIEHDGVVYGARPDGRGPIGGGAGYTTTVSQGDYLVDTVPALLDALSRSQAGQTIFIPGDAELDFTDAVVTDGLALRLPGGVTLASDRGLNGSPGALLCSSELATNPQVEVCGSRARITGLRLRGPDPERRLQYHYDTYFDPALTTSSEERNQRFYDLPNSDGIRTVHAELEVDNCEISAWSHSAMYLVEGDGHHVHHNFIHHCQRMGLGYGVCHNRAQSLIEYNLFQDNKHAIAGTGAPGSGYDARHNVVLAPTESHIHPVTGGAYGQDHVFDMHGGEDRQDGTDIAGECLRVTNNTFMLDYVAIIIRGVSERLAEINHNCFKTPDQENTSVMVRDHAMVRDNLYNCKW